MADSEEVVSVQVQNAHKSDKPKVSFSQEKMERLISLSKEEELFNSLIRLLKVVPPSPAGSSSLPFDFFSLTSRTLRRFLFSHKTTTSHSQHDLYVSKGKYLRRVSGRKSWRKSVACDKSYCLKSP